MNIYQKECAVLPNITKHNAAQDICPHYPSLEKDTICFHQTCRQTHTQVLCSFCDQEQQLHQSHTQELFPIHRVSPAFRLLDRNYSQASERILAANIEESNQAIRDLQALFQSFIEQVTSRYFNRLQCFSDFLSKNATFKVCNKVRHKSSQHHKCCLPFLNRLKDLEDAGRVTGKSVEEIIMKEAEREKSGMQGQIDHISAQIKELLSSYQRRTFAEQQFQDEREVFLQRAVLPIKQEKIEQSIVEFGMQDAQREEQSQETNGLNMSQNRQIQSQQSPYEFEIINEPQNIAIPQGDFKQRIKENKSIVISTKEVARGALLSVNAEQTSKSPIKSRKPKANLNLRQEKSQSFQYFKGAELISPDTVRIWKLEYNTFFIQKMMNYIQTLSHVKHIVIQSNSFTSINRIKQILNRMGWLQGIHIHRLYHETKHKDQLQIKQFSIFPTYRYLRLIDKVKYFNCANSSFDKEKKIAKIKKLQQQPFYNKMYIYKSRNPSIPSNVEELQFFSPDFKLNLSQNIFRIDSVNHLAILSFINISFGSRASFEQIFTNCPLLHTMVFEDCQASYNRIFEQFKHLRVFQLKHLQISCDGLDKKAKLAEGATAEIFRLLSLQTLILTNIQFVKYGRNEGASDSSVLKGISNLRELSYLNLYSSEPVCNDLLTYVHKDCHKKMELLNIGCSQVTKGVGRLLQKFTNLKSLCVDYTCIDDKQLLDATKEMQQLKFLSIENLNGTPIVYEQEEFNKNSNNYGKVTPYFFENMRHKHLQYLNVSNCNYLEGYLWEQFGQLEYIHSNFFSRKQFLHFRRRGVVLSTYEVSYNNQQGKLQENYEKGQQSNTFKGFDDYQEDKIHAVSQMPPHKFDDAQWQQKQIDLSVKSFEEKRFKQVKDLFCPNSKRLNTE